MNPQAVNESFLQFFSTEVHCTPFDDRVACDFPVYYPDGDSVVVFVREDDGILEVTDYGEGFGAAVNRPGAKRKAVKVAAQDICGSLGVGFSDGRVAARSTLESIGDTLWRVASASARIAEATTFARAEKARDVDVFADEVEVTLRDRRIEVARDSRIVGASGHEHRPTLFVPKSATVMEPVTGEAAWVRATSVYAEFGDLSQADSYKLISILDDRTGSPSDEVIRLLTQVSDVAPWTRRAEWMLRLAS